MSSTVCVHACMAGGVDGRRLVPNATVRVTTVDGALTAASPTTPGQAHTEWGRCGTVVDNALRAGDGDPCYRETDQTVPNWSKAGLYWMVVYYCP